MTYNRLGSVGCCKSVRHLPSHWDEIPQIAGRDNSCRRGSYVLRIMVGTAAVVGARSVVCKVAARLLVCKAGEGHAIVRFPD